MALLCKFAIVNMEASIVMGDNGYTQKEMINKVMIDIDKLFEKLDQIQKDLATRPTRQEIYGWIIAGISIATLITVLL
tara:strand:- start:2843 stop:3076 length:234 start_codon:yes stop_codon:yes gene_type:complete